MYPLPRSLRGPTSAYQERAGRYFFQYLIAFAIWSEGAPLGARLITWSGQRPPRREQKDANLRAQSERNSREESRRLKGEIAIKKSCSDTKEACLILDIFASVDFFWLANSSFFALKWKMTN